MLINVKVKPAAAADSISQTDKDSYFVSVKALPRQGQANAAVAKILSEHFQKDLKDVHLVRGFKQKNKVFEIK
jgi:hypothetical protein